MPRESQHFGAPPVEPVMLLLLKYVDILMAAISHDIKVKCNVHLSNYKTLQNCKPSIIAYCKHKHMTSHLRCLYDMVLHISRYEVFILDFTKYKLQYFVINYK